MLEADFPEKEQREKAEKDIVEKFLKNEEFSKMIANNLDVAVNTIFRKIKETDKSKRDRRRIGTTPDADVPNPALFN